MARTTHSSLDGDDQGRPRVGLVGVGRAGFAHWAQIQARTDVTLVAVCRQRSEEPFQGITPTWTDHRKLLQDCPLAGLVVATPPSVSAGIAIDAIQAGVRTLMLEKPGATTADELRDLRQAATANNASVLFAYPRRHQEHYRAVKRWIEERRKDAPFDVSATWSDDYTRWFDGGASARSDFRGDPEKAGRGALLESGSHLVDTLLWLLGNDVMDCKAITRNNCNGFDTYSALQIKFRNGTVCAAVLSPSYGENRVRRLTIRSRFWTILVNDEAATLLSGEEEQHVSARYCRFSQWDEFMAVLAGRPTVNSCDLSEAIDVVSIIDRAYENAAEPSK